MNSLESEYSFLAPTWKLPPIGTQSMYPGPSNASPSPPDASTWNNTMHNPRYVPPNKTRRTPQQPGGRHVQRGPPPQSREQHRNNGHSSDNQSDMPNHSRQNGHPPPSRPSQKRVQIIDHSRQTPSSDYLSERESQNSHSPEYYQKQKSRLHPAPPEDSKSESPRLGGVQRMNNFKIHEYLYGLAAPNPGSYVDAYKDQRRRKYEETVERKPVLNEYRTFVQNGGFGPAFGNANYLTYEEKLDTEKKRKSYSKTVRQINQYKVEEHKRIQNNGGQQRNGNYKPPMSKYRRPDTMRSHFISPQEVRDFERRIKREHDANCKCSLHAKAPQSSS